MGETIAGYRNPSPLHWQPMYQIWSNRTISFSGKNLRGRARSADDAVHAPERCPRRRRSHRIGASIHRACGWSGFRGRSEAGRRHFRRTFRCLRAEMVQRRTIPGCAGPCDPRTRIRSRTGPTGVGWRARGQRGRDLALRARHAPHVFPRRPPYALERPPGRRPNARKRKPSRGFRISPAVPGAYGGGCCGGSRGSRRRGQGARR